MKQAVLLLAHGAPERLEDVDEYLLYVRGGRPLPPSAVAAIKHRYAAIGGSSPLLHWTRGQAEALQQRLGLPVYFGMRNWHPFIKETIHRMQADGIERVVAICMAPQYSKMSVGFYFRRTQEAKQELGLPCTIVWAKSFYQDLKLIEAFAEALAAVAPTGKVLFTAHSLPEKVLQQADPYATEAHATAAAVAARLGLADWDFAYQSQGMTADPWLGPTVESKLDEFSAAGIADVVLHPIGFVCDHVEILYDVDILFRHYAAERGIALRRPASLNGSALYTEALADVAARFLE